MNPTSFSHYTKYTINSSGNFTFGGSSATATIITDTNKDDYITFADGAGAWSGNTASNDPDYIFEGLSGGNPVFAYTETNNNVHYAILTSYEYLPSTPPSIDTSASYNVTPTVTVSTVTYDHSNKQLSFDSTLPADKTIDASKITLTGNANVTNFAASTFTRDAQNKITITLVETPDAYTYGTGLVQGFMNKVGATSVDGTSYTVQMGANWNDLNSDVVAATTLEVTNIINPSITSATYNESTGLLEVTGANFVKLTGSNNDITLNKFSFSSGNSNYTLTSTNNVEVTSSTQFSARLAGTDLTAVNNLFSANGSAFYSLSAADDWNTDISNGDIADTSNTLTVGGIADTEAAIPTLTSFLTHVTTSNEDTETEITLAMLEAQGNEADSNGTVDGFVVQAVSTGSLKIGTSTSNATAFALGNNTIDATHHAYWTPANNATGANVNAFTVKAQDNTSALSATAIQTTVSVVGNNDAPTLGTFNGVVDTTPKNTEVELTFAELITSGNENDVDGTVEAFVVSLFIRGTLFIGASRSSATAYNESNNNTIDPTHNAYWTPVQDEIGTKVAFYLKAKDDDNKLSDSGIIVQVEVTDTSSSSGGSTAPTSFTPPPPVSTTIPEASIDPIVEEVLSPINIGTGIIFDTNIEEFTFEQTTIEVNGQNTINTTLEPVNNLGELSTSPTYVTVPLGNFEGGSGINLEIPQGIGFDASGSEEAQDLPAFSSTLEEHIQGLFSSNPDYYTSVTTDFFGLFSEGEQTFFQQNIVLTSNNEEPSDNAIVFDGSHQLNLGGENIINALTIDASTLPLNAHLELKNIDFAVIQGGINVTADDLKNTLLIGDSEKEQTVFTKGGEDLIAVGKGIHKIHGGSSNDVVKFEGQESDYKITYESSKTILTSIKNSNDIVTLFNIENLEFSDKNVEIKHDESLKLDVITGAYAQILGRQPHVKGVEYWSKAVKEGDISLGGMALSLLSSDEQKEKIGFDINTVDPVTQIKQLFAGFFGRLATPEGEKFWSDHLKNGTATLEEITTSIVITPEMESHYRAESDWDFAI